MSRRIQILLALVLFTVAGVRLQAAESVAGDRLKAATMDAGVIGNYTDILCMDKTEMSVVMSIENLRAASLSGTPVYAYLLILADSQTETVIDTLFENNESIDFEFSPSAYPEVSLPAVFYIRRIVSTDSENWTESTGQGKFTVARNEYTEATETHCVNDLPVTGTYTYYDGRVETYVLRADTLEHVFYDRTELGCVHEHTVRCVTVDAPQVAVSNLDNVCQTESKMQISYSILSGAPNHCRLTFNETAKAAGFADTTVALGDNNIIETDLPTTVRADYEVSLQFYDENSTNGCESDVYVMPFNLNLGGFVQQKWDDVLFVDNNDKNCQPDCDADLMFVSYQWYKNGKPIQGATEQVYKENHGLNGIYYVVMKDTAGNEYRSCEIESRPMTGLENLKAEMQISPVPAQAGEPVTIRTTESGVIRLTDMTGRVIAEKETKGVLTLNAPTCQGMYAVTVITESGKRSSRKLTVK